MSTPARHHPPLASRSKQPGGGGGGEGETRAASSHHYPAVDRLDHPKPAQLEGTVTPADDGVPQCVKEDEQCAHLTKQPTDHELKLGERWRAILRIKTNI